MENHSWTPPWTKQHLQRLYTMWPCGWVEILARSVHVKQRPGLMDGILSLVLPPEVGTAWGQMEQLWTNAIWDRALYVHWHNDLTQGLKVAQGAHNLRPCKLVVLLVRLVDVAKVEGQWLYYIIILYYTYTGRTMYDIIRPTVVPQDEQMLMMSALSNLKKSEPKRASTALN